MDPPTPFTVGSAVYEQMQKSFDKEKYVVDPNDAKQVEAVKEFYTKVMLLSNMSAFGSTKPENAEGYEEAPLSETRTVMSRYI